MNVGFAALGILMVGMAGLSTAAPTQPGTLPLGAKAPDFDLKGFTMTPDGAFVEQRYQMSDFDDAKLVVLIFTCNHCPTAQAYEERIKQLVKDYRPRGVAVVAISSNNPEALRLDEQGFSDLGDSYEETQARARTVGFDFPYLWDGDEQVTARDYGAAATPHVFILDGTRKLRYQGRIDNSENPQNVTRHEVREALDALLAGREPPVTQTRTFGCSTKWIAKQASAKKALEQAARETATLDPIDAGGIEALMRNDSKNLRLVNVWATWCGGCAAEFPELVKIHRIYRRRDFEMITVCMDSQDRREMALEFLKKQAASCRNAIYASDDRDQLAEALDPRWSGALPYTLLVAPGGQVIYRHTGIIEPAEVKRVIVDYVGRYFFKTEPKLPPQ